MSNISSDDNVPVANSSDKPPVEEPKDNISVTTDWETDVESPKTPPKNDTSKQQLQNESQTSQIKPKTKPFENKTRKNKQVSAERDVSDDSYILYSPRLSNPKTSKTSAREKAFKELDLAANDPTLAQHMTDRRELAQRLENDAEFRQKYIEEQKRKAEEDCVNSEEFNNALKHINKLQGNDDSMNDMDNMSVVGSISDDGSVQGSYYELTDGSFKKSKKAKAKKAKSKSKKGIHIKKLVVEKLVLNF